MGRRAAPDRHLADRPHLGMHPDQLRRQRARADHQQPRGIGAGQVARREAGSTGSAPLGQHGAVEQRQGGTGRAVQQQILAVDRGQRALAVVGEHRDDLDADPSRRAARPGRHQQQHGIGRMRAERLRDGMMMPRRHLAAGAKQLVEAVDQRQVVECGIDVGRREDLHENGPRVACRAIRVRGRPEHSGARCAFWSRDAGPRTAAPD